MHQLALYYILSKVNRMNLNEEEYENTLDCMIDTWNNYRNGFEEDEEDECTFALMISAVFKRKISRGSQVGRSLNLLRNFEAARTSLMKDYFDEKCLYTDKMFR